jgi:[phosphatase 2A protein]-leucine-carboxy methyltransferase
MSNPQGSRIPDLRTLLSSYSSSRGRGRGRGKGELPERFRHEEAPEVKDTIVQRTDYDAATSRMSAVELGYLVDPFARAFTPGVNNRRFPIMNRGMASVIFLFFFFKKEKGNTYSFSSPFLG